MTGPRVWLDDEGGWTAVPGISRIAIDEQHAYEPPIVKTVASWVPACDTGRHTVHPGQTCDEVDEWIAYREAWLEARITEAMQRALLGDLDGSMRGILGWPEPGEPTPIERALTILTPYLACEPLYQELERYESGGI